MKKTKNYQLLEEFSDFSNQVGLLYQKVEKGFEANYRFDRPVILYARCASLIQINIKQNKINLDIFNFVLISPNVKFEILSTSSVADWCFILPSMKFMEKIILQYNLSKNLMSQLNDVFYQLPRENWMNEIMHRYVYEKIVANTKKNLATDFLEEEITKELLFALLYAKDKSNIKLKNRINLEHKNLEQKSPLLQRAIAYIETHLYSDITLIKMTKDLNSSSSSLTRAFKTELQTTPMIYLRNRRFEEACILLRSGTLTVKEVAARTAYESTAAFIASFKKQYGFTPSKLIPN